ncbi:MAG: hypothetical protein ACK4SN_01545 [Bellilinea sp.]
MNFCASDEWFDFFSLRKGVLIAIFSILSLTTIVSLGNILSYGHHFNQSTANSLTNSTISQSTNDQSHKGEKEILIRNSLWKNQHPSIVLRFRLDKIQIGLIQNFSVRDHQIFLLGSYGLALLDLDQNETRIMRLRNTPVGIDNDSRIWYLTENTNSIFQWDGQATSAYRKEQGWTLPVKLYNPPLPEQKNSFLTEDQNIWLATSRDVRFFNSVTWRIFTANEIGMKLPYKSGVESFLTISRNPANGDIWVAACYWQGAHWIGGSTPYQFDGKTWRKSDFPGDDHCVTSITFTVDGSGYLATPTGIWKYDGRDWMEVSLPFTQNLPQNTTYQIGQIWIDNYDTPWTLVQLINRNGLITQHLLFQYHDTTFNKISSFEGLAPPQILFTSSGSLISFRNNKIFIFTQTGWDLLANHNFDLVVQDNNGNIWLISDIKGRPVLWEVVDPLPIVQGENQ